MIAVAAVAAVPACGNGDGNGDDGDGSRPIGADAYSALIEVFLPPVLDKETRPVVYIAHLGDEPFPLEHQVSMIEVVEERYDLRFVDDIAAAVDAADTDAPPRDDGLLIGVGTISAVEPHTVRTEVYTTAGRINAYKVTLEVRDDTWRVDTSEPIDVEVLVGDE